MTKGNRGESDVEKASPMAIRFPRGFEWMPGALDRFAREHSKTTGQPISRSTVARMLIAEALKARKDSRK